MFFLIIMAALASYTSSELALDQCIWRSYQLYETGEPSGRQYDSLGDELFPNDQ
jgi:hypothetical protein